MRKVISVFQTISILIGFMALALFIIPNIIGIKPFIVRSGSMESTIKTGSIAYVNTHVKVQDIKEHDIIAFNVGNTQATHRVIAINENNTFTTKGDANENEDLSPVKFEDYKGKTIFSIPYVGKLIIMCQTRVGHFIICLIIGLNILCIIFSSDDSSDGLSDDSNDGPNDGSSSDSSDDEQRIKNTIEEEKKADEEK